MGTRHLNLLCFLDLTPAASAQKNPLKKKNVQLRKTNETCVLRERNARRVVAKDNAKQGDFIGLPPRQHGAVAAEERHAQVWLSELRLLQALLY